MGKREKDGIDKKKAKQGGDLAKPKEINPTVGERTPANNTRGESSLQEVPNQKEDTSAAKGQQSKKGVKPTLVERTPAKSPSGPPSQGADTEKQVVAVNIKGKRIASATPGGNVPMISKKKNKG